MDTLSGEATLSKMFFSPFDNGLYSKRKEFAGSKFFPFRGEPIDTSEFAACGSKFFPTEVDPFSGVGWCVGKQTGSHKTCLPCKKGRKSYKCIQDIKHIC